MLDHIYGKPSTSWKRIEVILIAYAAIKLIQSYQGRADSTGNLLMRWFNQKFTKYTPWQIALSTLLATYLTTKITLFSPMHAQEQYARYYSKSFYRATWLMIALDAGFLSARRLKPRIFREIMSIVMSLFYLVFSNAADYKVRRLRSAPTLEMLRLSWEKTSHPLLAFVTQLRLPRITWCGKVLTLPRHPSSYGYHSDDPKTQCISVYLYYAGDVSLYSRINQIILHYPGGGFVCMNPQSHQEYLCTWASMSPDTLIVAVDYAKAPEYPYPFALEECFDLYKQIRVSNGACLGLEGWYRSITVTTYHNNIEENKTDQLPLPPLKLVVSGDSAGATLATSVITKAIENNIRVPDGLVLIYPFLNIDLACWLPPQHSRLIRVESEKHINPHVNLHEKNASKHSFSSSIPFSPTKTSSSSVPFISTSVPQSPTHSTASTTTPTTSLPLSPKKHKVKWNTSFSGVVKSLRQWREPPKTVFDVFGHASNAKTLAMTSRLSFFNDRILTPEILRALALLYLGPSKVPVNLDTDYLLSPILTPTPILQHFPKVYLICGEKDPLVDDVVIFAHRLREAKPDIDETQVAHCVILEGLSHAFMNMLSFLKEGQEATRLIHHWFMDLFKSSDMHDPYFSSRTNLSRSSSTHTVVPKETVDVSSLLNRRTLHMSEGLFDEHLKVKHKKGSSSPKE